MTYLLHTEKVICKSFKPKKNIENGDDHRCTNFTTCKNHLINLYIMHFQKVCILLAARQFALDSQQVHVVGTCLTGSAIGFLS
jgi:hypothetical protein